MLGNVSQILPVDKFEWIEETSPFNGNFIKDYNEESDSEYCLEVDVQYPEKLHELMYYTNYTNIMIYHFYQKKWNLKKSNLLDKNEYVIHMINLKQPLNHGLILKKVHRMIRFD